MTPMGFTRRLLFLLSGLLVWAVHFGLVYAVTALACARGFSGNSSGGFGVVPLVIAAATCFAVILQGLVGFAAGRGRGPGIGGEVDTSVREFERYATVGIAVLGAVAVVWLIGSFAIFFGILLIALGIRLKGLASRIAPGGAPVGAHR